jgi:hypothetical protein
LFLRATDFLSIRPDSKWFYGRTIPM